MHGDKGAKFSKGKRPRADASGIIGAVTTMATKDILLIEVEEETIPPARIVTVGRLWRSEANGQVYGTGGLCPTICAGAHGGVQPKILVCDEKEDDAD